MFACLFFACGTGSSEARERNVQARKFFRRTSYGLQTSDFIRASYRIQTDLWLSSTKLQTDFRRSLAELQTNFRPRADLSPTADRLRTGDPSSWASLRDRPARPTRARTGRPLQYLNIPANLQNRSNTPNSQRCFNVAETSQSVWNIATSMINSVIPIDLQRQRRAPESQKRCNNLGSGATSRRLGSTLERSRGVA